MIKATAQVTAVRDPEMRFLKTGKGVATIRVVSNRRQKDANGQWVDGPASFFDVECWDHLATQAVENVTKGTRLLVSGRLTCETWEDNNGNNRVAVKLTADDIALDVRFTTYTRSEQGRVQPPQSSPSGQPATESPF